MANLNSDDELMWGKVKGTLNKEKKYYHSFFYEDEEYRLFDNVIVYDEEEPDGHVAKIMKLWEELSSGKKMSLLRWFIRPDELPPHLQAQVLHGNPKELFLAFGKGKGVCNENKLDCIVRKCKVLCTCEDGRNKQPSEEDLRDADHFFRRIYNVDLKKLSNIEGIVKILGQDVLFNKPEWFSNESDKRSGKLDADVSATYTAPSGTMYETLAVHQAAEGGQLDSEKRARDSEDSREHQGKSMPLERGSKTDVSALKKPNLTSDKDKEKRAKFTSTVKQDSIQASKGASKASQDVMERSPLIPQQPLTRSASAKRSEQHISKVEAQSLERKTLTAEEMFPNTGKAWFADPLTWPGSSIPTRARSKQLQHQDNILPKKTWDAKVEESLCHGKVLLIQNVDPLFTSADIHDLIRCAFKGCSDARILRRGCATSAPSGEALLLFETEDLANSALQDLEENCLVLSGCTRPLIASKVAPPTAGKVARFPGHFPLDNFKLWKQRQEEVMKKSFEISHFSDPNTVEFEMAMEWQRLQEMLSSCWDRLYKIQRDETSALLEKYKKPKLTIP